jgi:hypothetical protein
MSTGNNSAGGADEADGSGDGEAISEALFAADSAISVMGRTAVGPVNGGVCLAMDHQRTASTTPTATIATGHKNGLEVNFKEILSS